MQANASSNRRRAHGILLARSLMTPPGPNRRCRSIHLDVGGLDDRPPLLDLGLVMGGERLGNELLRRWDALTQVADPLAHIRIGKGGDHGLVQLGDDGLGRALGCPQAMPTSSIVGTSGKAGKRVFDMTVKAFILPAPTCGSVCDASAHIRSICPAI